MQELQCVEELLEGRRVRALYVGGGTPTALSEANLERVLGRAAQLARRTRASLPWRPEGRIRSRGEKLDIIKASGAGA